MINFVVANVNENSPRYNSKRIGTLLKAQIENSIECGWGSEEIVIVANFDFKFMGVESINVELNKFCWTGSKLFALKWFFEYCKPDEPVWTHDLDCWQNFPFKYPEYDLKGNKFEWIQDVAAAQYSNPKFNGGSIFWKPSAEDIVHKIVDKLTENKEAKEEPTLNRIFKSAEYMNRIAVINYSYNVGCSGFAPRYDRSIKPIHVCHFHPMNSIAWEIHGLDREGLNYIAVTIRLERLLRRYYPEMATILKKKRKKS